MFRSLILASALMLMSATAFAQDTATPNPCANVAEATRNLGPQATETLLESCRKAAPTVAEKLADPVQADKWATVAKGFAEAIGNAAKGLGIAANDFLNSPAGYLLAAILLFNYAGGAIIGFPFTIFSMLFWWTIVRRSMIDKVEYENVPMFWGAITVRRKKVTTYQSTDYTGAFAMITGIALIIMNIVVWVNVT